MRHKRVIILLAVFATAAVLGKLAADSFRARARDVIAQRPVPGTQPTTAPAAPTSLLRITIDGAASDVRFPPTQARLLDWQGGSVLEVLGDAGTAIFRPNYRGNYYYFHMRFDSANVDLQNAHWQYQPTARPVSTDAICLDGGRRKLVPAILSADITREGAELVVRLRGEFRVLENLVDIGAAEVSGTLRAPFDPSFP